MTELPARADLQALLDRERARGGVAGAVLAVGVGDGPIQVVASGQLNVSTGESVQPDSLFEIGSLTKVPVASLALQRVAEGQLSLDQPIREVVPGFRVADPDATAQVTLRQLLSHTSGIDGDYFLDTGDGPDALSAFADACSVLGQLFAPGTSVSYSNAGYALAGWVVEQCQQRPFAEVFERSLDAMLGEHSLRIERRGDRRPNRADGHVADAAGTGLLPLPRHLPPYAHAPAGARTSGRIEDVVRLARLHLAGDPRLLPREWIEAMQRPQAQAPAGDWEFAGRGLGWELFGDGMWPGHDGATPGQAAYLRLLPAQGLVIAAAATGPGARGLFPRLVREWLPEAGTLVVAPPPPRDDVDVSALLGRYGCRVRQVEIVQEAGALWFRSGPRNDPSGMVKPARARLRPAGPTVLMRYDEGADAPQPLVFVDFDATGRPGGVHVGQRLHRRLDAAS